MNYLEIIEKNLDIIIDELRDELKNDSTIYQFIDSDFTLEKLFNIQKLLAKEYLKELLHNNINEKNLLKFYEKIDVPYPVIYKCMSALKIKILHTLNMNDLSKSELLDFSKKFDLFNNLLAKIYIKKDIHILHDLKESPFKKYLMYKVHINWIEKIIYALENDKLEEYPLISAEECQFNKILNYPESLMVCIDMNKCTYLHNLHELLHKSANSVYILYLKKEYVQAYLVFKELKEQSLKFIATINELYFIAYSDLENVFFNFLTLIGAQKNFYITLIDFRNLKSLNSIYGKEYITKALNKIEENLKKFLYPIQDKCFLIRGITANFYFYASDISREDFLSLIEEIEKIISQEIIIDNFKIIFEYIITALFAKENCEFLNSDDLVKILIHLKEEAKKENKTKYLFINDEALLQIKKWYAQKYNFQFLENKLKNKEFDIVFQPIMNNKTKVFEFFETLIRIKDEDKLISAGIFIDKIYEMGKITELDLIVLELIEEKINLIKQLTSTIFVNVSFVSLFNEKYIKKLQNLVEKIDIVLELTEQKMVENLDIILNINKNYNIVFAIDDFGSGYSSFKTVIDLTKSGVIKFLKIDGTLIKNIDNDIYLAKVAKVIGILGNELNLRVIAEFVENEETFNILKSFSIDLSQGYFIGKPQEIGSLIVNKKGALSL